MISDKTTSEPTDDYEIYTDVYDIFYHTHIDTDILDSVWKSSWTHVLEIGVGTGRLIPYFNKKPLLKYVGLDVSAKMIDQIDKRLLNDTYTCFCMGIRDYHSSDKFELIHYSYNTFNYILSVAEASQETSKCAELLADDGVIFLDLTFPGCVTRGISPDYQIREQVTEEHITHLLKCKDAYDSENQIETRYLKYLKLEENQLIEELNWMSTRRFYPILELLQIADSVGLSLVSYNIYGEPTRFFGQYEGYFAFFEKKPF